jgi:hypothetical protein
MFEPSSEFGREIASDYARINTCDGEWILKLAEFDAAEAWHGDGCSSLVQWLQVYCEMGRSTAKEKLRVARELSKRPVVARALRDGTIPYTKARGLTRLEGLDNDRDERYVAEAPNLSMPRLEAWIKQWNYHGAPERKPASLEDHYGLRRERGFGGGLGRVVMELPDDDIDRIFALLDVYIDHVYRRDHRKQKAPSEPLRMPEVAPTEPSVDAYQPSDFEPNDDAPRRPRQAQRLDALIDLLEEVALVRDDEIDVERASITVNVQYETLFERANGLGITEGGSELSGEAVRRLCCDANLHRVVVKGPSAVLDVGGKTQTWNKAQRRAIRARHNFRCAAGGCGRRITHIHHVNPYGEGGPTCVTNGVPLCFFHHHLVHEGGWAITYNPNTGVTVLISPDNQRIETQAMFNTAA